MHRNLFWYEARAIWDSPALLIQKWVVKEFHDEDASSRHHEAPQETLSKSVVYMEETRNEIEMHNKRICEECRSQSSLSRDDLNREIPTISVKIYLVYVNSVIHRPNSLKVILHSLLQFLWHLEYEGNAKI